MRALCAIALVWVLAGTSQTDPPDKTLQYYLDKSQYALAGKVLSDPVQVDRLLDDAGGIIKKGQVVYLCRIMVTDQFQHPIASPLPKELPVCVVRWPDPNGERLPGLKKGEKCIFFLKWVYSNVNGASSAWVTSDPWFGVLRFNPNMAKMLKVQGKRKEPNN